jgi:hypothetical protein
LLSLFYLIAHAIGIIAPMLYHCPLTVTLVALEIMEAKEQQHSRINYAVAIGAGLLLFAIIGFIVFKVQRSMKTTNPSTETTDTIAVAKFQRPIDTAAVKIKPAVLDSAKLKALFEQYFKKDSVPSNYPKFLTEAFIGYNFGDYIYLKKLDFSALPETMETIEANNREAIVQLGHYYKGIAGIVTNDSPQAKTNLQWSIGHASHEMSIKAKWFLALTYIKLYQPDKAIGLLKPVAASNLGHYKEQAKKLLGDLDASSH